MKKVLVIMEDDAGGPRLVRYGSSDEMRQGRVIGTRIHVRDMVTEAITVRGLGVLEATNLDQLVEIIETRIEEIGTVLVVEQGAGDISCLRYLETIRAKCGENCTVIGIAETIACMEKMEALRVSKLFGVPIGIFKTEGVLKEVIKYIMK